MTRKAIGLLTTVGALYAAPAAARQIYFHKAGVEQAAYETVETECYKAAAEAMRTARVPPTYADPAYGAAGAMGNAIGQGLTQGLEGGRAYKLTLTGCFKSHGFTVRAMPGREAREINKLPKEQRPAAWMAIISAAEPNHPELPFDEYD